MIEILIRSCILASQALKLQSLRLFWESSFKEEPDHTYTPHIFETQVLSHPQKGDQLVAFPMCSLVPIPLLDVENCEISCFAQIAEFRGSSEQSEIHLRPAPKKIRRSNHFTHLSIRLQLRRTTVPEGTQRILDTLSKNAFDGFQDRGFKPQNIS